MPSLEQIRKQKNVGYPSSRLDVVEERKRKRKENACRIDRILLFDLVLYFSHAFVTLYVYETSNCVGLPVYAYVNVENQCAEGTQTSCDSSTGIFTASQYNELSCEGNVSSSRDCSTGCNNFPGEGSYSIVCSPNVVLSPGTYVKLTFYSNGCNESDITSYAYVPLGECTSVGTWTSFLAFGNSSVVELETFSNGVCNPNGTIDTTMYNLGCNFEMDVSITLVNVTTTPAPTSTPTSTPFHPSIVKTKWKLILIVVFSIVGGLGLVALIVYLYCICHAKKNGLRVEVTVRA